MKSAKYQKRFYRDWVYSKDLFQERIEVRETDLQILTDKPIDKVFVLGRIRDYRGQIEKYITRDKRFLTSLKPIAVEINSPPIVREMARASGKANVGPMATVAGAIAQFLGKDLLRKGYKDVIIENGGDIFLKTTRPVKVGIYSGRSKFSKKIALKVKPKNSALGICASSGTIGHSLSFGCAESVVIISMDAILSDAVATAAGNIIHSANDLPKGIAFCRAIKGVSAALIIFKNNLFCWGDIELV
ncbi:MAG: UPF0280 family protein [Candidatus Omnitrophota bacterium]|nr:UPF0280 family protein [Candidatus Omnitrophota bacterium]MBU1928300.1 UPF0280 family protein [Candidatus Omnitrophota bacterium]MBU2035544.1 UPF0280 family protein [Candidatus Omnitrophota bacterium]MBU2222013.1 UPF0280 family protein [Candidatus Omnitrophota bacterium]MBU2257882.1 UPF0280 family protein [Candidatus Omnitrophota bacterium]